MFLHLSLLVLSLEFSSRKKCMHYSTVELYEKDNFARKQQKKNSLASVCSWQKICFYSHDKSQPMTLIIQPKFICDSKNWNHWMNVFNQKMKLKCESTTQKKCELSQKKAHVNTFSVMICLHSLIECGQSESEEDVRRITYLDLWLALFWPFALF